MSDPRLYATIGGVDVWQLADGTIHWRSGMRIDVDGAYRAAHPDGRSGLDSLANVRGALVRGADGRPLIQGPHDPAPGHLIVGTALVDGRYPEHDPRRYVQADVVPYGSIPPELLRSRGGLLRVGDLGAAQCAGRWSWLIVADVGPSGRIGEGSPALAQALGIPSDARRGGCPVGVEWWIWPDSAARPRWPRPDAAAEAARRWAAMGLGR